MKGPRQTTITEADLQHWKLLTPFHQHLQQALAKHGQPPTWQDPQRLLHLSHYLSLFLFGLINRFLHEKPSLYAYSFRRAEHNWRDACSTRSFQTRAYRCRACRAVAPEAFRC